MVKNSNISWQTKIRPLQIFFFCNFAKNWKYTLWIAKFLDKRHIYSRSSKCDAYLSFFQKIISSNSVTNSCQKNTHLKLFLLKSDFILGGLQTSWCHFILHIKHLVHTSMQFCTSDYYSEIKLLFSKFSSRSCLICQNADKNQTSEIF